MNMSILIFDTATVDKHSPYRQKLSCGPPYFLKEGRVPEGKKVKETLLYEVKKSDLKLHHNWVSEISMRGFLDHGEQPGSQQ